MRTLTETASAIGDKVAEARETVDDVAQAAGKTLDAGREETAGKLRTAASSIRTTGRQSSQAIDRIAKGTAERLESTASFVQDCDLKSVSAGLRQFARRHVTGSLVVAAALGFLAGSALRRGRPSRAQNM